MKFRDDYFSEKVLFFYPNTESTPGIPVAIPILAGIAKKLGWGRVFFDTFPYAKKSINKDRENVGGFKMTPLSTFSAKKSQKDMVPDIQSFVNLYSPKIIAITCMAINYEFLTSFWNKIHIPKDCIVIVGGVFCVLCPEEAAKSKMFDLIFTGEGDDAFKELLEKIADNGDISKIDGTTFFDRKRKQHKYNNNRALIDECRLWDTEQDYSIFDDQHFNNPYDGKILRKLTFEFARGCPYDCAYCANTAVKDAFGVGNNFLRKRPLRSAIDHLKNIVNTLNIDIITIVDDCFLAKPKEWLEEFSRLYSDEIGIPFLIQTRAESINEERIKILNKIEIPYYQLTIGVESGSERILFDLCNRNSKVSSIKKAFRIISQYEHIRSCGLFIIGFPTETKEEIFQTIWLARELQPKIAHVAIFQPFPGTRLRDVCIEKGFIGEDDPQTLYTEESMLRMPQISQEEISSLSRVFMLYVYLPSELFSMIRLCENDYENHRDLHAELVKYRWNPDTEQYNKLISMS